MRNGKKDREKQTLQCLESSLLWDQELIERSTTIQRKEVSSVSLYLYLTICVSVCLSLYLPLCLSVPLLLPEDPNFQSPAAIYAELGSHGGEDVGLWADGPLSWLFSGSMENSEVAHLIEQVLCLYPDRMDCVVYSKPTQVAESYSSAPVWIAIISMLVALLSLALSLVLAFKRR